VFDVLTFVLVLGQHGGQEATARIAATALT